MQLRDIMSRTFECVSQTDMLRDAAKKMRDLDIGMLPVEKDGNVVGILTDRDITIRATATGSDPNTTPVSDVMSKEIFSCGEDDKLEQAAHIMEEHQIRRLMVKNKSGKFVGVLSLADLARHRETEALSEEILEEVSKPSRAAA